jgi:surfeit locus 1 family protein
MAGNYLPRIVILVATIVGVALTARLGAWQLDRAAQKESMQRSLDARKALPVLESADLVDAGPAAAPADTSTHRATAAAAAQQYRAVRLRGQWLADRTVVLENRPMAGRVGFIVLTPLQPDAGAAVIVQRGWIARDPMERTRLPGFATPSGVVEVVGSIALAPSRLFDFAGTAASGPIRQNLDLADYARETGLALRPVTIMESESPANRGDGLLRQWPQPAVDVHKHYGYAAQWFALAALLTGLYVWFQLIRPRLRRAPR